MGKQKNFFLSGPNISASKMMMMFSCRTRWAAEVFLLAGSHEIKWSCTLCFVYCQIFTPRLWISTLWAGITETRIGEGWINLIIQKMTQKELLYDLSRKIHQLVYWSGESMALWYLSESESQDMLRSFCRSSSEWNRLRLERWTAWATEYWVLPSAQACILDTLSCDCRKRCRQLSDNSRGFWRTLESKDNEQIRWLSIGYCLLIWKQHESCVLKQWFTSFVMCVLQCQSSCVYWSMRSGLLFQKLLEPFHPLSDLLGVVQAEEGILWRQLW